MNKLDEILKKYEFEDTREYSEFAVKLIIEELLLEIIPSKSDILKRFTMVGINNKGYNEYTIFHTMRCYQTQLFDNIKDKMGINLENKNV